MTLKNRYERIMEKVEVTDEMHERIMKNINEATVGETKRNIITFYNYRKYLSIAACFAILLIGTVMIHAAIKNNQENIQQVVPDIKEFSSIDELSDAVGFKVRELKKLPFEVTEVKYLAYWGEISHIEYINQNNTIELRMAISNNETNDISGIYYDYQNVKSINIDNYTITIKGDGENYSLAVWKSGGYSYSISITSGISESEMLDLVRSVQ